MPNSKRPRTSAHLDDMTDSEMAESKTVGPNWTTDGTLLMPAAHPAGRKRSVKTGQPNLEAMTIFKAPHSSQSFDQYRALAQVEVDGTGIPQAQLPVNVSFADFATSLTSINDTSLVTEKEMWDLLQILFDSQDSTESPDRADAIRKGLLSQFWKSIVTPKALAHMGRSQNDEEKALAHLSANDIWGATEALITGGNPRLATMMSQIDAADHLFKDEIARQIDQWRESNTISEIPQRIRALYELLAGNACTAKGKTGAGPENKAEDFNISARFGLDWRRSFGLRLWYVTLRDEPIDAAIASYNQDLSTYQEQVRPTPSVDDKATNDPADKRVDVLWSLLKLYAKVQQASDPPTEREVADLLSPDNLTGNPLEARLSFLLCQTLRARDLIHYSNGSASSEDEDVDYEAIQTDDITSTLLAQLSRRAQDLTAAVFVALHLTHAPSRQAAVQALLERHAAHLGNDAEASPMWQELVQLQIPEAWIWNAKATYARTVLKDEKARCIFLLRAGKTSEACDVLRNIVAPNAVVAEELLTAKSTKTAGEAPGDLKSILAEFQNNDEAGRTNEWSQGLGGALYVQYVQLVEKAERHRKSGRVHWNASELQELKGLIVRVERGLPNEVGQEAGLSARVAAWEMSRVTDEIKESVRTQEGGVFVEEGKGSEALGRCMPGVKKASEAYYRAVGFA